MSAWYELCRGAEERMVRAVCDAANAAEAERVREEAAAVRIQGAHRMRAARKRFRVKRRAACEMQRVWRGYQGRRRAADRRVDTALRHQRALFDHFASVIQKIFRGWYYRRWVCDFHAQKRYLREVEAQSQRVREASCAYEQEQLREEEERRRETSRAAFDNVARSMRHLCSTATQPGVLRPTATVDGVPLRADLQESYGASAEDAVRAPVVRRRKYKPDLPTRGTCLQASCKYGVAEESDRLQRLLDKRLRLAGDFMVGHTKEEPYQKSIRQGDGTFGKPVKLRSHLDASTRVSKKPLVTTVKYDLGFDGSTTCELSKPPRAAQTA